MTPERLAEIRAQLDKVPECRTGNVEDLAEELLAEVDRLEAVVEKVRVIVGDIRKAAKRDDERRVELIRLQEPTTFDGMEKIVLVCRMDVIKTTADALEAAIARPLDSPPAKR